VVIALLTQMSISPSDSSTFRAAALPEVLHHHGHFAELAADDLLHLHGEQCIRLLGLGGELQCFAVAEHVTSQVCRATGGRLPVAWGAKRGRAPRGPRANSPRR
jgi:hypothetical protein